MQTLETLDQFIGSESFHAHPLTKLVYTDGVKYLAETAGAFWLVDIVASYQHKAKVAREAFQLWTLQIRRNKSAVVTMKSDCGQPAIITQRIDYSDFPLDSIELYCCANGNGVTLMLPSEY